MTNAHQKVSRHLTQCREVFELLRGQGSQAAVSVLALQIELVLYFYLIEVREGNGLPFPAKAELGIDLNDFLMLENSSGDVLRELAHLASSPSWLRSLLEYLYSLRCFDKDTKLKGGIFSADQVDNLIPIARDKIDLDINEIRLIIDSLEELIVRQRSYLKEY
jgi:hypothetical protein